MYYSDCITGMLALLNGCYVYSVGPGIIAVSFICPNLCKVPGIVMLKDYTHNMLCVRHT